MLLLEDRRFYVYIYLDPRKPGNFNYGEYHFDFEPFYVGKGYGERLLVHLQEAKKGYSSNMHKINKINKIIKEGFDLIYFRFKDNLTEIEAYEQEEIIVRTIGRLKFKTGPLTNILEGGRGGMSGVNNSMYGRNDQCYVEGGLADTARSRKGKTWEIIFGEEKAAEIKSKADIYFATIRGKTLVETRGEEKAKEISLKMSENNCGRKRKGLLYEDIYGESKALEIKQSLKDYALYKKENGIPGPFKGLYGKNNPKYRYVDIEKIKELISLGYSSKEISEEIGETQTVIKKRLKEEGIKIPKKYRNRKPVFKLDIDIVILKNMYNDGKPLEEIASFFNVKKAAIRSRIKYAFKDMK